MAWLCLSVVPFAWTATTELDPSQARMPLSTHIRNGTLSRRAILASPANDVKQDKNGRHTTRPVQTIVPHASGLAEDQMSWAAGLGPRRRAGRHPIGLLDALQAGWYYRSVVFSTHRSRVLTRRASHGKRPERAPANDPGAHHPRVHRDRRSHRFADAALALPPGDQHGHNPQ